MEVVSTVRPPLVTGGKTASDVTNDICRQVEGKPSKSWLMGMAISLTVLAIGLYATVVLLWEGIGVWGLNKTVGWAWDITNFVWWVGIGHAGTLISAILLLFRQKWRMSINRAAEAMTIFAVICAAMFPGFWSRSRRSWLMRLTIGAPPTPDPDPPDIAAADPPPMAPARPHPQTELEYAAG